MYKKGDFEFDFERLKVYQKSLDFIDSIFRIYERLSRDLKYTLGGNLIRAGLSIANNIAEGSTKRSSKEKRKFYEISSGSARECISVFNVLKRQNLLDDKDYIGLRSDGREITSMLRGLIDSL